MRLRAWASQVNNRPNKVQVFSRAQNSSLAAISIPAPPGATQRLWGIGLSPDGTKLAISDGSAPDIYLLDPSNPASVQTFSLPTVPPYNGIITNARGVAVSDAGIIYYAASISGGSGYNQFFKLDSNTGIVTPLYPSGEGDSDMRALITSDNSTVYFNTAGNLFTVNTSTDAITHATVGCCPGNDELTLSGDQTRVSATDYFYDSDLAAESSYALNDREAMNIAYVYGAKLNPDGSLLFQPSTNGIDVFDGRLGNLLTRISLPVALSTNYDALVADGTDSVLVAITGANGNGIAVVDLTSIAEPPPLPYDKSVHQERPSLKRPSQVVPSLQLNSGAGLSEGARAIPHATSRILSPAK